MMFFLLKVLLVCIIFSLAQVLLFRFLPVPRTPLMYIRMVQYDYGIEHDWVPMEEISDHMKIAIVAAEDGKFMSHNGFDADALFHAFKHNMKGKKQMGGSTISQQTAKNVFLWHGDGSISKLTRKVFEVYYTFLIEFCWDKQRILEVYLNSIEFGKGIYGIEAASQTYYHCHASELTRKQAETLAAIVPGPLMRDPLHPNAATLRHRRHIHRDYNYVKSHGLYPR